MRENYLKQWRKGLMLSGMLLTAFTASAYEMKVEAEDAFDFYHSGSNVKVETPILPTSASEGSYVGNMASGNAIAFELTDVPADGTYDFTIVYFGIDTNRKAYLKVNKQVKSYIQFSEKSADDSWAGTKGDPATLTVQLYLKKGTNRIEIGAYGGYAANLDYFTISESALSIPEPADETFCLKWDYTDEAYVRVQGVSHEEVLKAIDNVETTSMQVNADNLEIIVEIVDKVSPLICATGALITPGANNTGDITSWGVSVSFDNGATWTSTGMTFLAAEAGGVYRATLNTLAETGANMFKLTASGDGVIDIAEFQLFGVPTGADAATAKTTGYPKDYTERIPGDGVLNWTSSVAGIKNEGVENLFDDNWGTKFCQTGAKAMSLEFMTAASEANPIDLKSFTMTTGYGNFERIPTEIVLSGREYDESGNQKEWEVINSYTFKPLPNARYTCYRFPITILEGKAYWDFKFEIKAVNGGDAIQFVQLQFLNTEQTPELYPIDPEDPSGIAQNASDKNDVVICGKEGAISVSTQGTHDYKIYTTAGDLVKQGTVSDTAEIPMSAGLYIVVINGHNGTQAGKALVK